VLPAQVGNLLSRFSGLEHADDPILGESALPQSGRRPIHLANGWRHPSFNGSGWSLIVEHSS
jgi:hypothetical protein